MLTKDDLQAIKSIVVTNNNILATIFKAELAETNKKIDSIAGDTKELKKGYERIELKIDKLDYEERINHLEQRMKVLEDLMEHIRAKAN